MSENIELDIPTRDRTVLVVEDDPAQRMLYTRILMGAGYYVLGADNGIDAVSVAIEEQPGLILMDVTMPGKDGWTATREIKNDPRTSRIPVVLITGLTGDEDRERSRAAGCDVLLEKPVPIRSLMGVVMKLLP